MYLSVVFCMIALTAAAPTSSEIFTKNPSDTKILKYDNDNLGLGKYNFAYEQSDGTKQEQMGEIKNQDTGNPSLDVKGSFTWIGPDGVTYSVTFVANEDGYRPQMEQGPGGAVPAGVLATMAG